MTKRPNSRRNLDAAIERAFGPGKHFVQKRILVANAVVGQMLSSGVVKGGSSLKFRWGDGGTRFTNDLDTAYSTSLEKFKAEMNASLARGWNGFSGRLVTKAPAKPKAVPTQYVMQPFEVKLAYNGKSWLTVPLEVGHNEIGDADEAEYRIASEIVELFERIGLPKPSPVPCMPLHHQIAQKLHGSSEEESTRAHDLIDLQLIVGNETVDFGKTKATCERLFAYRKLQAWPPVIKRNGNWKEIYDAQKVGLRVLDDVDDAVAWANDLVRRIDAAPGA